MTPLVISDISIYVTSLLANIRKVTAPLSGNSLISAGSEDSITLITFNTQLEVEPVNIYSNEHPQQRLKIPRAFWQLAAGISSAFTHLSSVLIQLCPCQPNMPITPITSNKTVSSEEAPAASRLHGHPSIPETVAPSSPVVFSFSEAGLSFLPLASGLLVTNRRNRSGSWHGRGSQSRRRWS